MKSKIYTFIYITCLLFLTSACEKQQILSTGGQNVITLEISGRTDKEIEFIYNDKIIFSQPATDADFVQSVQLAINDQNGEIQIKEKGSSKVIASREIKSSPFNQTLVYESGKIYDRVVTLAVSGYAAAGELEFLMDGKILGTGSMIISESYNIFLNLEENKEFEVRLKGETNALSKQKIDASSKVQRFSFFFDGIVMLDKIPELTPPKDPKGMSLTVTFSSLYAAAGSIPMFTGEEVDIVFFVTDANGVVTKLAPEKRISIPTDGRFVTFELPPPPDELGFYSYDIYKKGTTELPYKDFDLSGGEVVLNEGRLGSMNFSADGQYYSFIPGSSRLLLLRDEVQGYNYFPNSSDYFTVAYGRIDDLSPYFQ